MNKNLTEIFSQFTLTDAENTTKNILENYKEKVYCIVHFLYFASIVLNELDSEKSTPEKENYRKALLSGDFLLPDGIALNLLYRKHFGKELPNLNGTDFLPCFLSNIPKDKKVEIFLYGATEETVQKSAIYIT
ncbi:hypothetical protein GW830_04760 [bacterium]|nr:hypothetical protein [bacterium]